MAEVLPVRSNFDVPDKDLERYEQFQKERGEARMQLLKRRAKAEASQSTVEKIQDAVQTVETIMDISAASMTYGFTYFLKAHLRLLFCNWLHMTVPLIGPKPLSNWEIKLLMIVDIFLAGLISLVIFLIWLTDPLHLVQFYAQIVWDTLNKLFTGK